MQRLIEPIQRELQGFVDQRDDALMVISGADADAAIVLQILRALEQASEDDVYVLLGDPFADAAGWVKICVARLQQELAAANKWLEDEEGDQPLPPLPPEVLDEARPAEDRLFSAMTFVRSLVPLDGGRRLVWVMAPYAIEDRAAYLNLLGPFFPTEEVRPWMRQGIRVVVRDEAGSTLRAPRTRLLPVDLGPEAMERALEEEAMDEAVPIEERMLALMMMAMQDYAHGRKDDALAKNDLLLGHYQGVEDRPMQAMVMNNIGDIHRKEGDLPQAQTWYESAVPEATAGDNPVIFHTVVKNLADVVYERGDYPMAEECYTGADQLAGALCDPEAKARALEGQGLSREQQGQLEGAAESWEGAASLCRAMGDMDPLLRPNLEHLARVYGRLDEEKKASAIRHELEALGQQEGTV